MKSLFVLLAAGLGAVMPPQGARAQNPGLDRSGYRARIVSIISAGSEENGKTMSVGMELPALVEGLKAVLRRGQATSIADAPAAASAAPSMPGKPARRIQLQGAQRIGTSGGQRLGGAAP